MIKSRTRSSIFGLVVFCLPLVTNAAEMPKLIRKENRYALLVDGQPYLIWVHR